MSGSYESFQLYRSEDRRNGYEGLSFEYHLYFRWTGGKRVADAPDRLYSDKQICDGCTNGKGHGICTPYIKNFCAHVSGGKLQL